MEGSLLAELAGMLEASRRAVLFTGAGASTESGISDFRSPGGIWERFRPIEFADFLSSEEKRRDSWRRVAAMRQAFTQARPNRGHRAIAELVRRGTASSVITQNIDGLHQRSGVPEDKVIELHGNATYAACLGCGRRYELEPLLAAFEVDEEPPSCTDCDGPVKTATISFGQPMPAEPLRRAHEETLACDLFIVTGSSLVVYPAAGFPVLAKQHGARLVILNRDPTELDSVADLVLHGEIGPLLGQVVGVD